MKCVKCGGEMEQGATVEYHEYGGGTMNFNVPKKETWGKELKSGILFTSVEQEREITTYRCTACGYLESYAK